MGHLDQRGDISIAIIVFYFPILFLALALSFRHGFSRQEGWMSILIFSIFRIVGAILHIAAEAVSPPEKGLYIAAFSLESAGIAALLFCTMSFLSMIGNAAVGVVGLANTPVFRVVRIGILVGFILAIVGASKASSSVASTQKTSKDLREAGSIILLISFVVLCGINMIFWTVSRHIRANFVPLYTLLLGATLAAPFILVRLIYSVLSAFAPIGSFTAVENGTSHPTGLARFNSFTGDWQIWLVMGIIMEFCAVLIYLVFGTRLPRNYRGDRGLESKETDNYNQHLVPPANGNAQYTPRTGRV